MRVDCCSTSGIRAVIHKPHREHSRSENVFNTFRKYLYFIVIETLIKFAENRKSSCVKVPRIVIFVPLRIMPDHYLSWLFRTQIFQCLVFPEYIFFLRITLMYSHSCASWISDARGTTFQPGISQHWTNNHFNLKWWEFRLQSSHGIVHYLIISSIGTPPLWVSL